MWGRRDERRKPDEDRDQDMNTREDTVRDEAPETAGGAGAEATGDAGAASLEQRVAQLEAERNELHEKYLRTVADYQNSRRRAVANEREAWLQGATGVILNVLTVMDHFDLALGQDPAKATAEQILSGVRLIRDELMRVLSHQGVTVISPAPNDEFDFHRHEAVTQADAEGVEPGRIVATLQAGYAMGDRVIRPAKVSVKPKE